MFAFWASGHCLQHCEMQISSLIICHSVIVGNPKNQHEQQQHWRKCFISMPRNSSLKSYFANLFSTSYLFDVLCPASNHRSEKQCHRWRDCPSKQQIGKGGGRCSGGALKPSSTFQLIDCGSNLGESRIFLKWLIAHTPTWIQPQQQRLGAANFWTKHARHLHWIAAVICIWKFTCDCIWNMNTESMERNIPTEQARSFWWHLRTNKMINQTQQLYAMRVPHLFLHVWCPMWHRRTVQTCLTCVTGTALFPLTWRYPVSQIARNMLQIAALGNLFFSVRFVSRAGSAKVSLVQSQHMSPMFCQASCLQLFLGSKQTIYRLPKFWCTCIVWIENASRRRTQRWFSRLPLIKLTYKM